MEYTIYNESLVYYVLRNMETQSYLKLVDGHPWSSKLSDATKFNTINSAKKQIENYPQFSQIRKVKVIDIGNA